MPPPSSRIVLDTNTLLRGFVAQDSASATVLRLAEARACVPLLSKPVMDEYKAVLNDPAVVERFPQLTPELVEVSLRRLRFVSDYLRLSRVKFQYRRDPRDEKFIELALALKSTHIVSFDDDLLSLPRSKTEAGRRFRQRLPGVQVLRAAEFLKTSRVKSCPSRGG